MFFIEKTGFSMRLCFRCRSPAKRCTQYRSISEFENIPVVERSPGPNTSMFPLLYVSDSSRLMSAKGHTQYTKSSPRRQRHLSREFDSWLWDPRRILDDTNQPLVSVSQYLETVFHSRQATHSLSLHPHTSQLTLGEISNHLSHKVASDCLRFNAKGKR